MKKIMTVILATAILLSVCSCWRKKPKPTESSEAGNTETETTLEPDTTYYTGPDYNDQTFETVGPNYTGTFLTEDTVPRNQENTPHKYYTADEIMNILIDLSTIKTGDDGKAYWDKVRSYQKDAPEQSPILTVDIATPDAWHPFPGKENGQFTITTGSSATIKLFIYDKDVMDEFYDKYIAYLNTVCGGTVEVEQDGYTRDDRYIKVTSAPSSAWGNQCYIYVQKDYDGRWDKNGYNVEVCIPVPMT